MKSVNQLRHVPGLQRIARPCFPKEQHESKEAAEAQLRSITRRGLEKDFERIHTYRCPSCQKWHVGHGRRV